MNQLSHLFTPRDNKKDSPTPTTSTTTISTPPNDDEPSGELRPINKSKSKGIKSFVIPQKNKAKARAKQTQKNNELELEKLVNRYSTSAVDPTQTVIESAIGKCIRNIKRNTPTTSLAESSPQKRRKSRSKRPALATDTTPPKTIKDRDVSKGRRSNTRTRTNHNKSRLKFPEDSPKPRRRGRSHHRRSDPTRRSNRRGHAHHNHRSRSTDSHRSRHSVHHHNSRYDNSYSREYYSSEEVDVIKTEVGRNHQDLETLRQETANLTKLIEALKEKKKEGGLTDEDLQRIEDQDTIIGLLRLPNKGVGAFAFASLFQVISQTVLGASGATTITIGNTTTPINGTSPDDNPDATTIPLWWIDYVALVLGFLFGLGLDYRESRRQDVKGMHARASTTQQTVHQNIDDDVKHLIMKSNLNLDQLV